MPCAIALRLSKGARTRPWNGAQLRQLRLGILPALPPAMTNHLVALGLASFLAATSFGCAAVTPGLPQTPDPSATSVELGGQTGSLDLEAAERTFQAMAARCQRDPSDRTESTRSHCLAATTIASAVLHDARRTDDLFRYRCAKFGASDRANPTCSSDAMGAQASLR